MSGSHRHGCQVGALCKLDTYRKSPFPYRVKDGSHPLARVLEGSFVEGRTLITVA